MERLKTRAARLRLLAALLVLIVLFPAYRQLDANGLLPCLDMAEGLKLCAQNFSGDGRRLSCHAE